MNYYVGLSLGSAGTTESGVVVIDECNKIIHIDKLFTMKDVQHFFDNFSSIKYSHIAASLPWDNSMLNGKWRILSKPYQLVSSNDNIKNTDNWTQRYSTRGCDYFKQIKTKCADIARFELYLTRQKLNLSSCYKERSPADCKFLQNILKLEYGFEQLPSNMMPMAQLEAIVGALLIKEKVNNPQNVKKLFEFNNIDVINFI